MSKLFEKIAAAQSKTKIKPVYFGTVVNFSNTSDNWFAATIDQLARTLKDILANLDEFKKAGVNYDEGSWRAAFKKHLSDDVAGALAGTQTLPYFDLLSKIIHYASSDAPYTFKKIDLDKTKIETAIAEIERIAIAGHAAEAKEEKKAAVKGGVNKIFYGAPGTGKTHLVDALTKGHETVRTVFHPDIQNSDFVGSLKPVMDGDKITYRFSPGPFAVALAMAVKNPDKFVSLIIEELNRAPAAAVFGELFLLLDRDQHGAGRYDTDFPNGEFQSWFQDATGTTISKLRLPSNFSIYATMNSADQGVYPLDTAFRRRWIQDYIEIDYAKAPAGNVLIATAPGNAVAVPWAQFVKVLNDYLTGLGHIQEDRLVGPWFLADWEINEDKRLPGKLLIYLWDDLLRHDGRGYVFATDTIATYGSLSTAVSLDKVIFSEELLGKITLGIPVAVAGQNAGA
jgi:hypothetical protein